MALADIAAGVAIAGTVAEAGTAIYSASQSGKGGGGAGGMPSWNASYQPVALPTYNPTQGAQDLVSQYPYLSNFSQSATATQTNLRNKIMPGSKAQFADASNLLQSELSGQVPQDVINQTQRAVAQATGGGYNALTGGGQSPDAFARSIGQTSLSIAQAGLSAAPTWQQLANSFVVSPTTSAQLANQNTGQRYAYDALNANIGLQNNENAYAAQTGQYNAAANNYKLQQINQQNQAQNLNNTAGTLGAVGQTGVSLYNAANTNQYYNQLPAYNQGSIGTQAGANAALGFTPAMASGAATYSGG